MVRAQKRDAIHTEKFFFRKDVFLNKSKAVSVTSSPSGRSSPSVTGGPFHKRERRLGNCFEPPPLPDNELPRVAVEDEYEEMTLDEIINGKASVSTPSPEIANLT